MTDPVRRAAYELAVILINKAEPDPTSDMAAFCRSEINALMDVAQSITDADLSEYERGQAFAVMVFLLRACANGLSLQSEDARQGNRDMGEVLYRMVEGGRKLQ